MLTFSIVINTYNRAHTLPRTLESLQSLRYPKFEVIVVNGPSTDGTEQVLERWRDRVKVGRCGQANLSMSRNIGIAMAAGDVVCFLDDDAMPEPDWLDQLATGYADPLVAAVGGYIRDHTGYSFQCKAVVCDRFGRGESFDTLAEGRLDTGARPFRFPSLTGTNSSFRRNALLAIGGFDEEFVYFLDETDVMVRLIDAGWRVEYVPNAEVHHKYASSHLRDANKVPRSIYFSVKSKAYFCIRHGAPARSLDEVLRHLEDYRRGLRRDYDWYLEHGRIDPEHHRRLHDEIDRGLRDGIDRGFADRPVFLAGEMCERLLRPFLPFARRPADAQRLRICFLSQEYPPAQCGGIGNWTHELAVGLAAAGHEISVVTKGAEHPTVDYEEGVWVHRIVPHWQPQRTEPALPDLPQVIKDYAYTAYDEVMRIHVRRGLDVVSTPIWDLEGAACIADGSIPTVLSLHSTFKLVLPTKKEWLDNPEYKAAHVDKIIAGEAWALQKAHRILANSTAIVRDIEQAYGLQIPRNRYRVVPHGIHRVPLPSAAPRRDVVRLLFVGRFELRKGVDLLLDALPALMQSHPQLEATLAGDHAINYDGKQALKDRFLAAHGGAPWIGRVRFPGVVSQQDLHALYADCDIFAGPSRYESFGLVFLEAMRYGKACVGARIGGIQEVVDDGDTGLLFEAGNAADLQEKLSQLLASPALRERLGRRALEAFEERFTTEAMAGSVAASYAEWAQAAPAVREMVA
ncbi:glycosyltransferase [Ramlibacter sp. USB13]|uniref:Glycosyltransferase n=1 Tax=Ramlibacter cellulosilyticus TaxID=2764187 RepID=A0A923SD41_9BURK|nr:glycosyltransferase [Ramlibacter cellulosilyticus]MBC5785605.1 glycosyltransferase [Ramlibacter cellulosilyticus]